MKFAVGKTDYFKAIGFNTEHWRKSLDGTLTAVHYDMVALLVDDKDITLYRHDDEAFKDLLMSDEWSEVVEDL